MEITKENIDELNASLKVVISPEDYQKTVKTTLEKYRKTAKIPGFRPGHVPFGLIQRQYGKSVLAEELNKITNEGIYKYIQDNKIEILGNPIPSEKNEVKGDFNNPTEFEFSFDLGLAPTFEVPLNEKSKFDYKLVDVDNELLEKQISDLRRRYGKLSNVEISASNDMLIGEFVELAEDGSIKTDGIKNSSTISLEFLEDKKVQKTLIEKKVNETIVVDIDSVTKGAKDKASMLGIKEDETDQISSKFQFTISEIKRMELAELNEELFNKLFGGEIKTEEEFKNKIEDDLIAMFSKDSDRLLTNTVYEFLLEKTTLNLPEDFLKRWIKLSNEKPVSEEEINAEFEGYLKSLKWQLIQNKIFTENNISIDQNEVVEYTKELLVGNYKQYGMPAPEDKELTESAQRLLNNKEQANGIYNQLTELKLTDFIKNTVHLKEKKVTYDEFVGKQS